jgi:hypothetical protein
MRLGGRDDVRKQLGKDVEHGVGSVAAARWSLSIWRASIYRVLP